MIKVKVSEVFERNETAYKSGERFIINQGGTSSTKTYSVLQLLYYIAYTSNTPLIISVVGQSLPQLKLGALRDWQKILESFGVVPDSIWQKTDNVFSINRSIVEFFSTDNLGKVHGPRRDILYINECNNISFDIYTQLEIRTRKTIFLDFNPVTSFWVHEEILPNLKHKLIKSTYLDNPFLEDSIKKSIESKIKNENWWRVYGLGEVGIFEGLIYTNVTTGLFVETNLQGFGLDFGYNDPDALVKVSIDKQNLKIYVREEIYKSGNSTNDLILNLRSKVLGRELIVADTAEARLIQDIWKQGFNIIPADKKAGSIAEGIKTIQGFEIIVESNSHNLLKELRNYMWNDKKSGIPIDDFNHLLDAMRYICMKLLQPQKLGTRI